VGYIVIDNFHEGAAQDTIAEIESMMAQGATKLLFDVRNNPGGYVSEMVELLDYLLPAGPLFQSVSSAGLKGVEKSDADCLKMPMAVLINGNTYSAAELFAAVLVEYDWAVTVGTPTTGKAYYQKTIELGDGSAVQLSIGAYTTPNGVNLTEVGGLTPDVQVDPAERITSVEEDPQIMAAIQALNEESM
jgi:carboxyl-terminal processing protease